MRPSRRRSCGSSDAGVWSCKPRRSLGLQRDRGPTPAIRLSGRVIALCAASATGCERFRAAAVGTSRRETSARAHRLRRRRRGRRRRTRAEDSPLTVARLRATATCVATSRSGPGRRRTRSKRPAAVMAPSVGTARRAAAGVSTSSKSGTGSPRRSCTGPRGQSPRLTVTSTPSATRAPTAMRSHLSRWRVSAHHQTYAIASRKPTAIALWIARNARAGDDKPVLAVPRLAGDGGGVGRGTRWVERRS